jgi:transposase-like protein
MPSGQSTRRRRLSDDEKARIIEATLAPSAVVSDVARRRGLTPQQLFTWRREARRRQVTSAAKTAPTFVPGAIRLPEGDLQAVPGDGTVRGAVDGAPVRWMSSDVSRLDLLAIQIDGLHVGDDLSIVAGAHVNRGLTGVVGVTT